MTQEALFYALGVLFIILIIFFLTLEKKYKEVLNLGILSANLSLTIMDIFRNYIGKVEKQQDVELESIKKTLESLVPTKEQENG